jgi:hypothetical protein
MRIALFLAASTLALAAHAGVTVTFVEPDKYTDAGRYGRPGEGAQVQKDLETHLVKLGERMPANQNLAIEVLDIDLAGEDRFHYGGGTDVRVLRGRADWPSIRLRYTLERDGRKETQEARLSDMSYQQRVQPVRPTETLPYEKRMLTDWFNSLKLSTQAK